MNSYVSLENICKKYDNADALTVTDFNLDIKKGEFVVFVGPSGCGKSTTLRMVAGLESITSGTLSIDGRELNSVHPKDRDIAMVFQNYALYPHMSVQENIVFGLRVKKENEEEIQRKLKWAANILGLEEVLKRKPGDLSGGQRQRVALGRAIVRNPKLFLMDEPLSNLDAKLRISMRNEITKLHRELGATTIYVTHDQVEAMTMADRVVVLKDGVIHQVGTPMDLYNHPANTFVATFIGAPQMNLYDGQKKAGCIELPGGAQVALSPEQEQILAGHDDVVIGVRPENVIAEEDVLETLPQNTVISCEVKNLELMGNENYVYIDFAGKQSTLRVDSKKMSASIGDQFRFAINAEYLNFFEKQSGKAISMTETAS